MQAGLPALFWRRPQDQTRLLSIGCVENFAGSGPGAMANAQQWLERIDWEQPAQDGLPRAWFTSTFDQDPGQDQWAGWPGFYLVLPQLVLSERAGQTEVLIQGPTHADLELGQGLLSDLLKGSVEASKLGVPVSDECFWAEPPSAFAARVAATTQALGDDLHKVVLANCRHHHYATSPLESVLENLLTNPRDGIHFAYTHGTDAVLAGCTPETLVRQNGNKLSAHVLAGTRRRGPKGAAQDLLSSAKDRREHDLVATGMVEALNPLVDSLSIPEEPTVRSLTHLHHLERHLKGATRPSTGFLDLVSALHPTPALGGYPQASALEFLRQSEGLERGGFGAPFGWISGPRQGHAAVAIRSALLRGDAASVFAGAGIVAQSDPHLERAEIDAKVASIETELLGLTP
jgi:isochorismate synthase